MTGTMELDRKHQCWISGGLIEYEVPRKSAKRELKPDERNSRAMLTLVVPRESSPNYCWRHKHD